MARQNSSPLASHVERARKVLQHEQRLHYQDKAILSGGLEVFASRWTDEISTVCQQEGLDLAPVHHFMEYLVGYRQQDPMQRAASLRAALSILDDLDSDHPAPPALRAKNASTPPGPSRPKAAQKDQETVVQKSVTRNKAEVAQPDGQKKETPTKVAPNRTSRSVTPQLHNSVHLEAGMSQGHVALTMLSADISALQGVGPTMAGKLHHLGIRTVRDLLFYFPREHRDYSQLVKIADIPFNELTTTKGIIWEVETKRTGGGKTRTIATISDETAKLYVSWFNQSYLQKQLNASKGDYLVVTGIKQRFGNKIEFSVRSHEFPEQNDLLNTGRLVPIYALTEGLHAKTLRKLTKQAVDRYVGYVNEHLPPAVRSAGELVPLPQAIEQIHYPESHELLDAARHRLAFDELFLIQLGMQERRSRWQYEGPKGQSFAIDASRVFMQPPDDLLPASSKPIAEESAGSTLWSVAATEEPFEATLPFAFTEAQRRVICEIFADLALNKPMCRLLQGDVGAGKTVVAAAALFMTVLNGYQGAIMAPTELLAEQHARSIGKMLEPFGIHTVLLTGSQRSRERALGRAALESGEAAVAIGTHALIQDDVKFRSLGLVIVDEQHRFGVEQRDALRQKGYHPHMLVMTATPIPRTLSLTLYGDLDVSVIDQLPPGRQKIITRWRSGARRREANELIRQQVNEGRQAFIICPLIEESETLSVKAATTEYERLQKEVFPELRLGLLHGAMKPAEKDQVMHRFRDHELDILVATSVIEVGIDIPNATVMVIEDADRFGLSQLHQFRGRVGRGKYQSYCYVLSAEASLQAQERLGVFQEIDDGFRLAEEDLRLRGPGDFIGVRQSGMPELRIADLNDTPLIHLSRTIAAKLWESDPYLRKSEHAALREKMRLFWQNFMAH
jgi:ATP-dependent DNA helicase RecG